MCPENSTLHSRCHGNPKSHIGYRRQTSENINGCGKQSPQNKAVLTSTKACSSSSSPPPPFWSGRGTRSMFLHYQNIRSQKIIIKSEGIQGTAQPYRAITETQKSHLYVRFQWNMKLHSTILMLWYKNIHSPSILQQFTYMPFSFSPPSWPEHDTKCNSWYSSIVSTGFNMKSAWQCSK
jgi:hypothetical protein